MELVSPNVKIDFLRNAKLPLLMSFLLIVGAVYMWFSTGDSKFGVDFKGGNEYVVSFVEPTSSDAVRAALQTANLENLVVQSFEGGANEFSIRVGGGQDSKVVRDAVDSGLRAKFSDKYQIVKADFIGPTIGVELRKKAIMATILALIMILCYVAFRFEFAFALGAVVALFHDVILATGVYIAAGFTLNMGTLAAALTIVGYSVNDTIVIFDRVREELLKQKDFDLVDLMNGCINATLSRTLITSLLTLFSAAALLVFGGGAIADLSLFLVVGILAGCYSTVFIASPVVLAWERFRTRKRKS